MGVASDDAGIVFELIYWRFSHWPVAGHDSGRCRAGLLARLLSVSPKRGFGA